MNIIKKLALLNPTKVAFAIQNLIHLPLISIAVIAIAVICEMIHLHYKKHKELY